MRVKATCTNDFPESLKDSSIWNSNSGTGKATSLLEEYNINREEGGDPELTRFQRTFLTADLKGTRPNEDKRCFGSDSKGEEVHLPNHEKTNV